VRDAKDLARRANGCVVRLEHARAREGFASLHPLASGMPSSTLVRTRLPLAVALAALVSAVLNLGVWRAGEAFARMTIGWREVVLMSVLGAAAGGVSLLLLGRYSSHPRRHFARLTIAVLVLYALGPISAMYAPYREGAERFNVATVIATEIMHLASGGAVYFLLARRALR
jgi:hypothetical protein